MIAAELTVFCSSSLPGQVPVTGALTLTPSALHDAMMWNADNQKIIKPLHIGRTER